MPSQKRRRLVQPRASDSVEEGSKEDGSKQLEDSMEAEGSESSSEDESAEESSDESTSVTGSETDNSSSSKEGDSSDSDGDGSSSGEDKDKRPDKEKKRTRRRLKKDQLRKTQTHKAVLQANERTDITVQDDKSFEPKPMVELKAGSNVWYQAYVLKESANEVKIEVPGVNGKRKPLLEWLKKGSSRIWRGSLRSEHWRHLGKGSWEPKIAPPASGKRVRGAGSSGKRGAQQQHRSAQPSGASAGCSTEHNSKPGGFDDEVMSPRPVAATRPAAKPPRAIAGAAHTTEASTGDATGSVGGVQPLLGRISVGPPASSTGGGAAAGRGGGGAGSRKRKAADMPELSDPEHASTHSPLVTDSHGVCADQSSARANSALDDHGEVVAPHSRAAGAAPTTAALPASREAGQHASGPLADPLTRWFLRHITALASTGMLGLVPDGSMESGALPPGFTFDPSSRSVVLQHPGAPAGLSSTHAGSAHASPVGQAAAAAAHPAASNASRHAPREGPAGGGGGGMAAGQSASSPDHAPPAGRALVGKKSSGLVAVPQPAGKPGSAAPPKQPQQPAAAAQAQRLEAVAAAATRLGVVGATRPPAKQPTAAKPIKAEPDAAPTGSKAAAATGGVLPAKASEGKQDTSPTGPPPPSKAAAEKRPLAKESQPAVNPAATSSDGDGAKATGSGKPKVSGDGVKKAANGPSLPSAGGSVGKQDAGASKQGVKGLAKPGLPKAADKVPQATTGQQAKPESQRKADSGERQTKERVAGAAASTGAADDAERPASKEGLSHRPSGHPPLASRAGSSPQGGDGPSDPSANHQVLHPPPPPASSAKGTAPAQPPAEGGGDGRPLEEVGSTDPLPALLLSALPSQQQQQQHGAQPQPAAATQPTGSSGQAPAGQELGRRTSSGARLPSDSKPEPEEGGKPPGARAGGSAQAAMHSAAKPAAASGGGHRQSDSRSGGGGGADAADQPSSRSQGGSKDSRPTPPETSKQPVVSVKRTHPPRQSPPPKVARRSLIMAEDSSDGDDPPSGRQPSTISPSGVPPPPPGGPAPVDTPLSPQPSSASHHSTPATKQSTPPSVSLPATSNGDHAPATASPAGQQPITPDDDSQPGSATQGEGHTPHTAGTRTPHTGPAQPNDPATGQGAEADPGGGGSALQGRGAAADGEGDGEEKPHDTPAVACAANGSQEPSIPQTLVV